MNNDLFATALTEAAQAEVNVASIASSAMLTNVTIRVFSGRKKDKTATQQVNHDNHAHNGAALVTKRLLGNCVELEDIRKFAARIRNDQHYSLTMPWMDSGLRLLPTSQYFAHNQMMGEAKQEFDGMVRAFLQKYDAAVSAARGQLGYLFNYADYPSVHEIANKFEFSVSYMALPEDANDDWRLQIGQRGVDEIREHYKASYADAVAKSMASVWQRLHDTLSNLSTKLGANGVLDGKRIHASNVDNIHELVDMLKAFNLTGDPKMEALRIKLSQTLRGVTPEALREDSVFAARTKATLDDAIASLPSLDI